MREGRRWLHVGGLAVFGVAVVQLLLLVAARPPHDYAILLNSRAAGGLVIVTLLYVLAVLHRNGFGRAIGATPFILAANVVTLVLVTTEIDAYWYVRALVGEGADRLGRELMLSVSWALYATVLIVIGLRRKFAPVRYLAIAIFGVTILKVFFRDLAELEQFYRVSSIIALGVLLLLTSYLYNRSRRESPE
jgi:uncharacterized membrane protein